MLAKPLPKYTNGQQVDFVKDPDTWHVTESWSAYRALDKYWVTMYNITNGFRVWAVMESEIDRA